MIATHDDALALAHRGLTECAWRLVRAVETKDVAVSALRATEFVHWACAIDERLAKTDRDYIVRRNGDERGRALHGRRYVRDRAMHQVVVVADRDDRGFFNPRPGGVIHIASSYPVWRRADRLPLPESAHRERSELARKAYEQLVEEQQVARPVLAALAFLTEQLAARGTAVVDTS